MKIHSPLLISSGGSFIAPEFISRATAAGDAALTFSLPEQYQQFLFYITALIPDTDGTNIRLRFSDNGGVTYYSTSGDYVIAGHIQGVSTLIANSSISAAQIRINSPTVGTAIGEGWSGFVHIINNWGVDYTKVIYYGAHVDSGATPECNFGCGSLEASSRRVTNLQIDMSAGNIASGKFALYGIKEV